jgi:hypothetical protein
VAARRVLEHVLDAAISREMKCFVRGRSNSIRVTMSGFPPVGPGAFARACATPRVRGVAIALVLVLAGARAPGALGAGSPETISFNRIIEPILSENCYPCHGPDTASRKPGKNPLRLDQARFAFAPRDGGRPVIIKGDPAASEVVKRLKSTSDDELMPPPSRSKRPTPKEIALIETWIRQGALYEEHWSLIAPVKEPPPEDPSGWAKTPVDKFIAAKLRENGLAPNPEEDKSRLLRRASFDLTGLPPSPEELRRYLNDTSPGAYENAVDRYLASDASAEHFARLWLDAVRYADTQGIHADDSRIVWPYRDWVIHAYRSNMPFDEFTVEQLAGDLLANPSLDQRIATGYNRLVPTTGEAGAIEEEYAAIYAKDRVETTAAVWLGLTAGCATCHDHKFDPMTMRDYYSLAAFFRNSGIQVLDEKNDANTPPAVFAPLREERPRWDELVKAVAARESAVAARQSAATQDFARWPAIRNGPLARELSRDNLALHLSLSYGRLGDGHRRPGPFGPAPRLMKEGFASRETPVIDRYGRASYGAFVYVEDSPSGAIMSRMDKAEKYRGWDLTLSEGKPVVHVVDQSPESALVIAAKERLAPGVWHQLFAVFDGSRRGAGALSLYVDGHLADVDLINDKLGASILADAPFRLGARSDKSGVSDTIREGRVYIQDVRFYNRSLSPREIAQFAASGLLRALFAPRDPRESPDSAGPVNDVSAGRARLAGPRRVAIKSATVYERLYLASFDGPSARLRTEMASLYAEEEKLRERGGMTLVMQEDRSAQPVAYILSRGNYAAKGELVRAATPAFLPPMASSEPRNRLGLARWIVSRDNPLTARVTVNRLWASLFGTGIVETTEDFGARGARPGNAPLLDWLAVEFMESGWDFRRMIKWMVMSAAYRQSAAVPPEKLGKDPLNVLVSRGPRYRLDAEEIRDQALAASGLLVRRVGGAPTRPYQPSGVWEAVAMKESDTRDYDQDGGDALYRRSIYTFWKRSAPPPSMEIFNAPSREVFCARRERSDTPLQALVTMNDPQFVEAARCLAARALKSSGDFGARLDLITDSLLSRRLTEPERAVIRRIEERALERYQKKPAEAIELTTVGDSEPDETVQVSELAAWTVVASEIMNLDESLAK